MNSLTDQDEEVSRGGDREITLGTTTILAIFFGLAALCAAFFGFGYSLGMKHLPPAVAVSTPDPGPRAGGLKPAAGSSGAVVESLPDPTPVAAKPAPKPAETEAGEVPGMPPDDQDPAPKAVQRPPVPASEAPQKRGDAVVAPGAIVAGAGPAVVPAGQFVVQIAAVTHQEDADMIAATLKRRGYTVNIRPEPQDKLLHIQVGPFVTKKDAEAMRQRLLGDGFNAYIK